MQKTWVQSLGLEDHLEKGMALPSSILAWGIPWTQEPGGSRGGRGVHGDTKSWNWLSNWHTLECLELEAQKVTPIFFTPSSLSLQTLRPPPPTPATLKGCILIPGVRCEQVLVSWVARLPSLNFVKFRPQNWPWTSYRNKWDLGYKRTKLFPHIYYFNYWY